MSIMTLPRQHNGFQAIHSKGKTRVFLLQDALFACVVHSVGVSKYGHHTAQAQESLLDSGATNMAFFILGR